jgi:hypothetical protein
MGFQVTEVFRDHNHGDRIVMAKIDGQPCIRGKVRGKEKPCYICHGVIPRGADAFRPVLDGGAVERYMRFCISCVEHCGLGCECRTCVSKRVIEACEAQD